MFPGTLGNSSHVPKIIWGKGNVPNVHQNIHFLGNWREHRNSVPHVPQMCFGEHFGERFGERFGELWGTGAP